MSRTSTPPVSMEIASLIAAAKAVRAHAHAPYSKYFVGAALLTRSGRIYVGCNVENASYGATICAERNAIAQMVAAGERHPIACVVVTQGPTPGSPCGMCRQVLAEFAADMPVVLVAAQEGEADVLEQTSLATLFPSGFRPENLEGAALVNASGAPPRGPSRAPRRRAP